MEILDGVFERLDIVGEVLAAQFIIIVVLYFILDFLLFKKLLFVLQHRENKTTKLEGEAQKKLDEANVLAKEYREKIEQVSADTYKEIQSKRQRIEENEKENLKKTEIQINQDVEKRRKQIEQEILEKRNDIFQNQEKLSATFVEKLIN